MKKIRRLATVIIFIALVMALDLPTSFASDQPGCPDYKPPADQGTPGETPGASTTTTTTTAGQVQSSLPQIEGAIAGAMDQGFGAIDSSDLSGVFDSIDMDNGVAIYTEFETPSGVASIPPTTSGSAVATTGTRPAGAGAWMSPVRITPNVPSIPARQPTGTQVAPDSTPRTTSTGLRIESAKDDTTGLGISDGGWIPDASEVSDVTATSTSTTTDTSTGSGSPTAPMTAPVGYGVVKFTSAGPAISSPTSSLSSNANDDYWDEKWPDGTKVKRHPSGLLIRSPDGIVVDNRNDGTRITYGKDGTRTEVDRNGNVISGSKTEAKGGSDDGYPKVLNVLSGGTRILVLRDGTQVVEHSNGDVTWVHLDGSMEAKHTDGTSIERKADGTIIKKSADGKEEVIHKGKGENTKK